MSLPRPGAPKMDNLIATMWRHGNRFETLTATGLDRIADAQRFDPVEFRARFCELETILAQEEWQRTQQPQNNCEVYDGK